MASFPNGKQLVTRARGDSGDLVVQVIRAQQASDFAAIVWKHNPGPETLVEAHHKYETYRNLLYKLVTTQKPHPVVVNGNLGPR
jgi:hypothetical protein